MQLGEGSDAKLSINMCSLCNYWSNPTHWIDRYIHVAFSFFVHCWYLKIISFFIAQVQCESKKYHSTLIYSVILLFLSFQKKSSVVGSPTDFSKAKILIGKNVIKIKCIQSSFHSIGVIFVSLGSERVGSYSYIVCNSFYISKPYFTLGKIFPKYLLPEVWPSLSFLICLQSTPSGHCLKPSWWLLFQLWITFEFREELSQDRESFSFFF